MVKKSTAVEPVPIPTFRRLPTEQRTGIVLQGDQRLYGAEARIDSMAVAPVLYDAIWMLDRALSFAASTSFSVLAVGSQAKKAKRAKCAQC